MWKLAPSGMGLVFATPCYRERWLLRRGRPPSRGRSYLCGIAPAVLRGLASAGPSDRVGAYTLRVMLEEVVSWLRPGPTGLVKDVPSGRCAVPTEALDWSPSPGRGVAHTPAPSGAPLIGSGSITEPRPFSSLGRPATARNTSDAYYVEVGPPFHHGPMGP